MVGGREGIDMDGGREMIWTVSSILWVIHELMMEWSDSNFHLQETDGSGND